MTEADLTWTFAGVDARRWSVQTGAIWRAPVAQRNTSIDIPGRHGTIAAGLPTFEVPQLSFVFLCTAVGQAALESLTNELESLLTAPGLVLGRTTGGVTSTAPVRFQSLSSEEFMPDHSARFTASLDIPSVFLRGASVDSTPEVVTSGEVVTLAGLASSTGPITDAVLRITGPATQVTAIDPISGTGLSWTGTLAAGSYLFMHAATLTARIGTSGQWVSGGTDVSGALDYPGPGPLQIWPRMAAADPAVRTARVTVTGTGFTGATALTVRAQPAYL